MNIDVTDQVDFGLNDDESLPITRCVCGAVFPAWQFIIGVYEDYPSECPECGCGLYFSVSIKVYEVPPE